MNLYSLVSMASVNYWGWFVIGAWKSLQVGQAFPPHWFPRFGLESPFSRFFLKKLEFDSLLPPTQSLCGFCSHEAKDSQCTEDRKQSHQDSNMGTVPMFRDGSTCGVGEREGVSGDLLHCINSKQVLKIGSNQAKLGAWLISTNRHVCIRRQPSWHY